MRANDWNESKRAIWRGQFSVLGNSMNFREKFLAFKTTTTTKKRLCPIDDNKYVRYFSVDILLYLIALNGEIGG